MFLISKIFGIKVYIFLPVAFYLSTQIIIIGVIQTLKLKSVENITIMPINLVYRYLIEWIFEIQFSRQRYKIQYSLVNMNYCILLVVLVKKFLIYQVLCIAQLLLLLTLLRICITIFFFLFFDFIIYNENFF